MFHCSFVKRFLSLVMIVLSTQVFAAEKKLAEVPPAPEPVLSSVEKMAASSTTSEKQIGISFDYNSWFENIQIQNGGTSHQTAAMMYGVGISYEYSVYQLNWGYGAHAGYVQAYGVSGNSGDPTQYYAYRVPVSVFRGGGRLFYRLSEHFDLGLTLQAQMNKASWPTFNGMTVESDSKLSTAAFLDSRWRLNSKWDLLQSVGFYSKGSSGMWRIGGVYIF